MADLLRTFTVHFTPIKVGRLFTTRQREAINSRVKSCLSMALLGESDPSGIDSEPDYNTGRIKIRTTRWQQMLLVGRSYGHTWNQRQATYRNGVGVFVRTRSLPSATNMQSMTRNLTRTRQVKKKKKGRRKVKEEGQAGSQQANNQPGKQLESASQSKRSKKKGSEKDGEPAPKPTLERKATQELLNVNFD